MDVDDGLGLLEPDPETLVLLSQSGQLGRLRVGPGTAFLARQPIQLALSALDAPVGQMMRRVQAFPAQQCAPFAGRALIGCLQDPQFVLGGEAAPFPLCVAATSASGAAVPDPEAPAVAGSDG